MSSAMFSLQAVKPSCNRWLQQMDDDRRYWHHQSRLRNVTGKVNNQAPTIYPHIELKQGRLKLEQDRISKAELENQRMLKRLLQIMEDGARVDCHNYGYEARSLNHEKRKMDSMRIVRENEQIVNRLMTIKSQFDRDQSDLDWFDREQRLSRISRYRHPWRASPFGRNKRSKSEPKAFPPINDRPMEEQIFPPPSGIILAKRKPRLESIPWATHTAGSYLRSTVSHNQRKAASAEQIIGTKRSSVSSDTKRSFSMEGRRKIGPRRLPRSSTVSVSEQSKLCNPVFIEDLRNKVMDCRKTVAVSSVSIRSSGSQSYSNNINPRHDKREAMRRSSQTSSRSKQSQPVHELVNDLQLEQFNEHAKTSTDVSRDSEGSGSTSHNSVSQIDDQPDDLIDKANTDDDPALQQSQYDHEINDLENERESNSIAQSEYEFDSNVGSHRSESSVLEENAPDPDSLTLQDVVGALTTIKPKADDPLLEMSEIETHRSSKSGSEGGTIVYDDKYEGNFNGEEDVNDVGNDLDMDQMKNSNHENQNSDLLSHSDGDHEDSTLQIISDIEVDNSVIMSAENNRESKAQKEIGVPNLLLHEGI